ncbi:cystathionine gamma-synthase [Sodiomyces alkalinus F11]|uniref:cystathionine gamma-synthase n=1 Tax=Sodiomyces alkalinus (strain CBS 110278 / VKM F-3762 / F11) TaxID=1314773 RepID=A0A3N2PTZ2_SODAK|nr:cystathionine gamma-synthase [Sodiomyces alkalinus F11]ROT37924.1 cystathionine gamma-synthase [Sodiomyces alkalinus F11]
MPTFELGQSIPPDTAHAVSVSLPTWKANIGYEEGKKWVVDAMATGYPRFFIHRSIQTLAEEIVSVHGQAEQRAILFPTARAARRCVDFIRRHADNTMSAELGILDFGLDQSRHLSSQLRALAPTISAVLCSSESYPVGKQYWQHSGDGVSSRRAEFCRSLVQEGLLCLWTSTLTSSQSPKNPCRGPRRYQRASVDILPSPAGNGNSRSLGTDGQSANEALESMRFLEERFGRNLDISLVERAKSAIRRRIVGTMAVDIEATVDSLPPLTSNARGFANLQESDVYLFPCGMNAIFNAHQALLRARGELKSINYGFPYVDTLKILQKFGPGCLFYGHGSSSDLDDLEQRLTTGERFLALFCEFPANPLLSCPDLVRIRQLADKYDFAVVIDDTIGTFVTVDVVKFADIVVSSLTKIFSGDCNVMGGSAILNPAGRYYTAVKAAYTENYEDTYWAEDVVFMERNSRDFQSRIERTNRNSEVLCDLLSTHPSVKQVYYPKTNPTRPNYEACRLPEGGYGGLLSVTFHKKECAMAFFDEVETAKGPSLGTNFTLTSPYVMLAHYRELDWAAQFGVDPDLIRISVGLEDTDELRDIFIRALRVAEHVDCGRRPKIEE